MESIIYTPSEIGLEKPVRILQVTDVHLTKTNDADSDYHKDLQEKRFMTFYNEGGQPPKTPSEYFEEAVSLA